MEVAENKSDDDLLSSPTLVSPGSKSRYGRIRKPKVTRDFFNIDDLVIDETLPNVSETTPSPTRSFVKKSPEFDLSGEKSKVKSPRKKFIKSFTIGVVQRFDEQKGGFEESMQLCPSDLAAPIEKSKLFVEKLIQFGPKTDIFTQPLSPSGICDIKDEFTKFDDLGMKVANNFKANLQRGLDDSIKDRKFFKSSLETKVEIPNVVDVTKVLKLISKPAVIGDFFDKKSSGKSTLKTYSNKRKHLSSKDVVETFGLPDQPIVPLDSHATKPITNKKLDVDLGLNADINLVNPWTLDDFQQPPPPRGDVTNVNGNLVFNGVNRTDPGLSNVEAPNSKHGSSPLKILSRNIDVTSQFLELEPPIKEEKKGKVKTKNCKTKAEILQIVKAANSENARNSGDASRFYKGVKGNNVVYKVTKVKTIKPVTVDLKSKSNEHLSPQKSQVVEKKVNASPRRTASSSKILNKSVSVNKKFEGAIAKFEENSSNRRASLRSSSKETPLKVESPKKSLGKIPNSKSPKKRNSKLNLPKLPEDTDENKNSSQVLLKPVDGDSSITPEESNLGGAKSVSLQENESKGRKAKRTRISSDLSLIWAAQDNILDNQKSGKEDRRISRSRTRNSNKSANDSGLIQPETTNQDESNAPPEAFKSPPLTTFGPSELVREDFELGGEKKSGAPDFGDSALKTFEDSEKRVEIFEEDGSGLIQESKSGILGEVTPDLPGLRELVTSVESKENFEENCDLQMPSIVDSLSRFNGTSEITVKEETKPVVKITRSSSKIREFSSLTSDNSDANKVDASEGDIGINRKNSPQFAKSVDFEENSGKNSVTGVKKSHSGKRRSHKREVSEPKEEILEIEETSSNNVPVSSEKIEIAVKNEEIATKGRLTRNSSKTPDRSSLVNSSQKDQNFKKSTEIIRKKLRSSSRTPDRSSSLNQLDLTTPKTNSVNTLTSAKKSLTSNENEVIEEELKKTDAIEVISEKDLVSISLHSRPRKSKNKIEILKKTPSKTPDLQLITKQLKDESEILSTDLSLLLPNATESEISLRTRPEMCKSQVRIVLNPLSILKRIPENFQNSTLKKIDPTGSGESRNSTGSLENYEEYWPKRLRSSTGSLDDFPLIDWSIRRKKRNSSPKQKKMARDRKSKSPKKRDAGIVKTEIIDYELGDLAWARIGTHPFWPCLVTEEPVSGVFKKNMKNSLHHWYHVQFFGDKGRRAWVNAIHLMPYCGEDDLERMYREAMAEKKVSASLISEAYVVKPKKFAKWKRGVEEAQSLKLKTIEERLHYFLEFFVRQRMDQKRRDLEIKQEILEDFIEPLPKKIKVTLEKSKNFPEKGGKRPRKSSGDEDVKQKRFKSEENEEPKSLEESKASKLKNIQIKEEVVEESEADEEVSKLRNKRHVIQNEYSDSDSKFSDNSSVPASLESQAALYKRNNIFRGILKEKVCQICGIPGDIMKCKGPCNGFYHYNCAIIEQKPVISTEIAPVEKPKKPINSNNKVEIISVISRKPNPLPRLSSSPDFKGMSLAEQIDFRMKEIMKNFDYQTIYGDSADSSSEEFIVEDETFEENLDNSNKLRNDSNLTLTVTERPSKKEFPIIKHVTADNVNYICLSNYGAAVKPKTVPKEEPVVKSENRDFKCDNCAAATIPRCLICNKNQSKIGCEFRQKCSLHQCGRYYHPECLKIWPQTQWSLIHSTKDAQSDARYATFVCPRHVCHTCVSDDPRAAGNSRCPSDKVVKCLHCPATYHCSSYCVPAGTQILTSSQIICPRHHERKSNKINRRSLQTVNANWCFICSKGGDLICCETCPTSVHVECLPGDLDENDIFFCEDCQSGRLPLYDEIVWVKLGLFRWWPAVILFPNEVPDNVRNLTHNKGEFVVKFFGTYDHYWVGRGRTFLFQEGDKGHSNHIRKKVDSDFAKAIEEAAAAHRLKKQFKVTKVAEKNSGLKPPPYIRIKVNRPVGNVRQFDGNISNTTSCDCYPNQPHPCGPDSDCLNRLLLTECNPEVCPAGDRCNNQCFEKREYPPLVPHRTQVRGWGLKTLAPIRKGQFVIEYVGEMIDEQEYQRRVQKMHEQKEENYYFLTIDNQRMLDAGPKGNVARFMNHSCQPNCETQKWTVNGDTRVGLFAKCDIPADTELTFNYNLECIGKEKKICRCGAPNCSGFIGGKVKSEEPPKKTKRLSKTRKKKSPLPVLEIVNDNPCFVCGKTGDVGACNNKICTKFYHLECIGLATWPEGGKWVCPWHNCNLCSKRTIRCCIKCTNSYCPSHSERNVRYDKLLGFICSEHDPVRECREEVDAKSGVDVAIEEIPVAATLEDIKSSDSVEGEFTNLDSLVTSTPMKKVISETISPKSVVNKRRPKKDFQAKNTAKLFSPSVVINDTLTTSSPVRHLRTTRNRSEGVLVDAGKVTKTARFRRGYLL